MRTTTPLKAVAVAMVFFVLHTSCSRKTALRIDPAFAQYISAFTSGVVSAASTIRIRLTEPFAGEVPLNEPLTESLLEFSPSLKGVLVWADTQTLEFKPSEQLPRGTRFAARFKLGRLTQVPDAMKNFEWEFTVMRQYLQVAVEQIAPYRNDDLRWMNMRGEARLADVAQPEQLSGCVLATQNGRVLPVSWNPSEDPLVYRFSVDSVRRGDEASTVELRWSGQSIQAEQKGALDQEIPSLSDFKVFYTHTIQQPDQYVLLQFSDPLLPGQSLNGLIDIPSVTNERFTIENNQVRLFAPYRLSGHYDIQIHAGIKNLAGFASKEEQVITVNFEELKPSVKLTGNEKVILPSTNGLVFPFEAVNLSAVDVKVIRVFESNVPQFLQVNDLAGSSQMMRVGRTVKRTKVELNPQGDKNLAQWNTFYLQLDKIIRTEPGAIYRIELGFKREYSLYNCADSSPKDRDSMKEISTAAAVEEVNNEDDNWEYYYDYDYYYDDYDYYYDDDYDYSERENPCNSSYYGSRHNVARNLFASDLGLMVKQGTDGSLLMVLNDLRTAAPVANADIEVLNYQQQAMKKLKTDGDGLARCDKPDGKPWLVVAKSGRQRAYLKMSSDNSLSLSEFDITGQASEKGLKGFIYGERGVWRPGDTLHLAFMLQDEMKVLPAGHPVHFELTNPRGQLVQKLVRTKGEKGFYTFPVSTTPDAETGDYYASVRVGGATFGKTCKVETIKPNRLKLAIDFGKEGEAIAKDQTATLNVKWLHGAPAKNLQTNISATFVSTRTAFDKYKEYVFDDPIRSFSADEEVVFDGKLDEQGKATFQFNTDFGQQAPGMLRGNFSVKVFEEGGDFSTDRFSTQYAPYPCFVGIKTPKGDSGYGTLANDKNHTVELVTVDAKGKEAAGKTLRWTIYKADWRWWWESGYDNLARFVSNEVNSKVQSGEVKTDGSGKASFTFNIPHPNWGRYLIRVEESAGGHAAGSTVYVDWPNWSSSGDGEVKPAGSTMLMFRLDKDKYTVGEQCKVSFPSSGVGRAFVSIENATQVIQTQWVETGKEQTTFTFRTTEQMAPNAYVHITLLQPHKQTENDLPIRLYGVMPLFVENPGSHLEPVIAMADELGPEKPFEVKVSEKSGRAMTYTLAIVDEGLLDLTRFKTPDPWNYFYARQALGVNTYDMYDQVIGAYGSKLEKLLTLGGDEEGGPGKKNRANRFKPVVLYEGPFTIEAGKSKTHKLTMPNYIGSVRVMVVAGNNANRAYGNAEKTVPVKKPLMVLASLPRVLGPGEEVKLPVTVFAMDKKVKEVNVTVEVNSLFTLKEKSTQTLRFAEPGDEVVNFPLRVNENTGVGRVKVTVTSGTEKSSTEVEMDVRNPNPYITEVKEAVVEAGKSWSQSFDQVGMTGTNEVLLEVSQVPPVDFGRRLKYLLQYPHGCVEQTASGAFPQLFLADVIELSEAEKSAAVQNVKDAITRLSMFQLRTGGFVYWPGQANEDDWCTSYVGQFFLEAKAKGFTLPSTFETNWLTYQKRAAQNWQPVDQRSGNYYWRESDLVQAYRLYTLALAGAPHADLGAMNRLKEKKDLQPAARWRLAGAYALAGKPEIAKQLIKGISTRIDPYTGLTYTYGSNWRDEAMIIETLVLLNEKVQAAPLVKELAGRMSSSDWYSTQTVAYSLMAISKFAGSEPSRELKFIYTLNGKTSAERLSMKPVVKDKLQAKLTGNNLELTNRSKNLLYVRLISTGQPLVGLETPGQSNMALAVRYTDMEGKAINVSRMEQGTDFIAEVTVKHPGIRGPYNELALTQVFPSGWEIINQRFDMSALVMQADKPEYQDVRDDRVHTYFDLYQNQSKTFRVKLNATYLGRFYLPAVNCEAMYDNTINAHSAGQWVEVVKPGEALAQK